MDEHNFPYNGFREYAFGAAAEPYSTGYIEDGLYKYYNAPDGQWFDGERIPYEGLYLADTDTSGKVIKTIEVCGGFCMNSNNTPSSSSNTPWDGTFGDIEATNVALKTYDPDDSAYGGSSHIDFAIGTLRSIWNTSEQKVEKAPFFVRLPNGFIYAPNNEIIADTSGINCGTTGITWDDFHGDANPTDSSRNGYGWGTIGITIERINENNTDKDRVKFYLNGKLKATRTTTSVSATPITFPTTITTYLFESFTTNVSGNGYYSDIPICSVRLYDKILTENELKNNALYDVQKYGYQYV